MSSQRPRHDHNKSSVTERIYIVYLTDANIIPKEWKLGPIRTRMTNFVCLYKKILTSFLPYPNLVLFKLFALKNQQIIC